MYNTELYNYKNIFACFKKKIARNQALSMHYPYKKQVVKYIKNRRKHLYVKAKHIFHNCIDACMKK